MLAVYLLGSPHFLLDEQSPGTLRRKNRAVFYYVAAHAGSLTRDHLLNVFWAGQERAEAQPIFRTLLYELRKQLNAALTVEADNITLDPAVWVDVREFEKTLNNPHADSESLASAITLYRSDFLNDFMLPDCPEFNDWVDARRQYYRSLMLRGVVQLSQHYEAAQHYAKALDVLQHALTFDPLHEDIQCVSMRLRYLSGDRAGAIRQYDTFRHRLDEEMGVPPMPETRALYDAIISDKLSDKLSSRRPAAPPTGPAPDARPRFVPVSPLSPDVPSDPPFLPFTGRDNELRLLLDEDLWKKLIVIEGEPGIGKTRLAQEVIAACNESLVRNHQDRLLVLRGAGHELEQGVPYQPIIDALHSLLSHTDWPTLQAALSLAPVWIAEVARLVPELIDYFPDTPTTAAATDESRLWEGLNQFFGQLARQCRVILFVDDVQWADSSTVALLGYLVRRTVSPSFRLMVTARPVAPRATLATLLQTLSHENRLLRCPLAALSATDVQSLAVHVSPRHGDFLSGWLIQRTDGNPYFLTELVRYAYNVGLVGKDGTLDADSLTSSAIVPQTVQNLIQSRVLRLSDHARRILELAAVMAREFTFETVVQAIDLPEDTLLDAFDELQAAVLVKARDGGRYTLDHSLTLEVVNQQMSEARNRSLHRHVALALEAVSRPALDPVAGVIAYHFARGNMPARAAEYAQRAGQHAASLAAWAQAITFYEQALDGQTDIAQRAAIVLGLGYAHLHSGHFAQASEVMRSGLALAQQVGDLKALETVYLLLNHALLPQSRYAEAIELGQQLRASGPPELAIIAEFIWGTGLGVESADPRGAEWHLREAERLLQEQAPDGYKSIITLAQVKYQLAGTVGQQGQASQAVALYWEALNLVREDETALDLIRHVMLYNNLAYQLHLLGDPAAATYAQAGIKVAQEKGSLSHIPYLLSTSGEIALAANDLEQAERYFTEGLALARQIPIPERIAGLTANLGLVYRQRGQPDRAREQFEAALPLADQLGARHLGVRIRIWLGPLLPAPQAKDILRTARQVAESSNFGRLLEEIAALERTLG